MIFSASWLVMGTVFLGFWLTSGFDLGVGIVGPWLTRKRKEQNTIFQSIGPTWEGNQTWLILGVGGMFAMFPPVYGTFFSLLYGPVMACLFCFILRPAALKFREKHHRYGLWNIVLFFSSLSSVFLMGALFGTFFQGLPFRWDHLFPVSQGNPVPFFTVIPILMGCLTALTMAAYGLAYLSLKMPEPLAQKARKYYQFGTPFVGALYIITAWTIYHSVGYQGAGFIPVFGDCQAQVHHALGAWTHRYAIMPWLWSFPILSILALVVAVVGAKARRDLMTVFSHAVAIACMLLSAGVCLYPFLLPSSLAPSHSLTTWNSSSSAYALAVMLTIIAVTLPLVLGYTVWTYWVTRGRLRHESQKEY